MIRGHGIDLQELSAIEKAVEKHPKFVDRILTEAERLRFQELKGRRQMEYLAGRWAAKEAFVKALGTGIGPHGFQDIEVLSTERGAPYISQAPVKGTFWISISHSANYVQASVIWEDEG